MFQIPGKWVVGEMREDKNNGEKGKRIGRKQREERGERRRSCEGRLVKVTCFKVCPHFLMEY